MLEPEEDRILADDIEAHLIPITGRGFFSSIFGHSHGIKFELEAPNVYLIRNKTLDLSHKKLTHEDFIADIKKITDFIKENKIECLNLDHNCFDYIPLELIRLLIEAPSLKTASLRGNFNRTRSLISNPEHLKIMVKGIHFLIKQFVKSSHHSNSNDNGSLYKQLYIENNMEPLQIPALDIQKTGWEKLKPYLINGLYTLLAVGSTISTVYLCNWLFTDSNSQSCSC